MRFVPAALAVLALGSIPACGGSRPLSVLLVVIDTLRYDHVGSYGYARPTTPGLDALAAESVRFERAYAPAPWTKPTLASILTGLYPSGHGAIRVDDALPEAVDTLAEILADRGYRTAGVVSQLMLSPENGFDQGAALWLDTHARGADYVSSDGVTEEALSLLDGFAGEERPFFLLVHYFDPHYHYQRHPEVGFAPERAGRLDGTEKLRQLRRMRDTLSREELDLLRALYDEEIRFTDAAISRLLAGLRARGLDRDTLVVVTADHGEEFLERGWLGHTRTLHEELLRVPLLIRDPRSEAGPGVVRAPVSLVSLAATVLELAGVPAGSFGFHEASLAAAVRQGREPEAGVLYAEVDYRPPRHEPGEKLAVQRGIVSGRYKLVRDDVADRVRLFDLVDDPGEQRDLAASRSDLVAELLPVLEERSRALRKGAAPRSPRRLSPEESRRLRDLGYLGDDS